MSPLLRLTAVPCTHDGHLHYHRIAAMRYAWENGAHFSRWLPDVAFGLGYPFFVYREAPPLFASLIPHLWGLPLPAAENLFYALTILACGWFMFLWVRDILGPTAGLVAGAAYMGAPYVLIDALIRGNSPESMALPFLPLLLWLGRRWLLNGRVTTFLATIFCLALFSLSHNISLLIFTPLFLLYLLFIGWLHQQKWRTIISRILLIMVLGLGMTIFYTGGALLELGSVTLEQSTTTRNNDFHFNFVGWAEILAPVAPEDPTLLNPDLLFRLGWVPIGLALCGIVIGIWKMASQSRNGTPPPSSLQSPPPRLNPQLGHLFFMSGATAVFLFMALPASLPLWENLPLIDFVQFPWRFVGRASLPVAFLAGVPFASFATEKARPWPPILASLAIFLLLLEVMPNLYPNYCLEESFPTIQTVHTYERETGLVGVDPEGSYFPRSVQKRPSGSPLETAYQQNQLPLRFDLPAQVRGTYIEVEPLGAVVEVESSEPFTAVYQSFAFAGWKATVDQEPVPIIPSVPLGLISFEVPAGRHTLSVQWGSTPLRSTLLGLSILSLAGTAVGALVLFSNQGSIGSQQLRATRKTKAAHQFSPPFYLLLTSLLLITLKFGLFDRLDTPFRQTGAHNLPPTPELRGGELQLTHYTLSQRAIPSDGVFEVRMAWQAAAAPTRSYQTNVWLEDEAGQLWSDKNTFRPRKYEDAPDTIFWPAGAWAWENWEIEPLSGTPEGSYKVVMTLFDLETLAPLTLTDQDGQSLGPTAVLGEVWITSPTTLPEFSPQFVLETAVPNTDFNLLGFNQDRTVAQPGEEMLITLFVEKTEGKINQSLTLSLEDDRGNKLADWDIKPGLTTSADSRLRLQRVFRLPGGLDSGTYQFSLQETVKLGRIDINAPERLFEQPAFETAVNQTFSNKTDQITLIGYTQSRDQFPLSLELVWQPLTEMSTSYRVFVHLVTVEGQIVAQSDGEPANWRRPTTGWAISEYIQDTHQLTLPPDADFDQLHLRVGLYNPETGSRLFVDGKDFIEIGR